MANYLVLINRQSELLLTREQDNWRSPTESELLPEYHPAMLGSRKIREFHAEGNIYDLREISINLQKPKIQIPRVPSEPLEIDPQRFFVKSEITHLPMDCSTSRAIETFTVNGFF